MYSSDIECLFVPQHTLLWNKEKYLKISPGHLLMKLDEQNMTKKSFRLAASESYGDVCAAECLVNGQRVRVVTVYVSPTTPSGDWKPLIFSNLAGYSPKVCKMFKVLARRGY
jgi:hypothetical protein